MNGRNYTVVSSAVDRASQLLSFLGVRPGCWAAQRHCCADEAGSSFPLRAAEHCPRWCCRSETCLIRNPSATHPACLQQPGRSPHPSRRRLAAFCALQGRYRHLQLMTATDRTHAHATHSPDNLHNLTRSAGSAGHSSVSQQSPSIHLMTSLLQSIVTGQNWEGHLALLNIRRIASFPSVFLLYWSWMRTFGDKWFLSVTQSTVSKQRKKLWASSLASSFLHLPLDSWQKGGCSLTSVPVILTITTHLLHKATLSLD